MDLFNAEELASTLLYGRPETRHGLARRIAEERDEQTARILADTARLGEGLLRVRSLEVVGLLAELANDEFADLVFDALFPVGRGQVGDNGRI